MTLHDWANLATALAVIAATVTIGVRRYTRGRR